MAVPVPADYYEANEFIAQQQGELQKLMSAPHQDKSELISRIRGNIQLFQTHKIDPEVLIKMVEEGKAETHIIKMVGQIENHAANAQIHYEAKAMHHQRMKELCGEILEGLYR